MIARMVTLLPQPDSPTRATCWPSRTFSDTPFSTDARRP